MLQNQLSILRPDAPSNLHITAVTDTTITFAWDTVDNADFYLIRIAGETRPRQFNSSPAVVTGLVYATVYSAKVSAVNGVIEGNSSDVVTQKTLLPKPTILRFLYGETYINGTSINSPSITNCRIYRKGETTALLTGTITAGVLRIYVLGNVNIIPGNEYDIRAIDGNPNLPTSAAGMPTTITAELAKITLNNVVASSGVVSGTTENNGQVRISVDGVNKTVFTATSTGSYTGNISGMVAGSVVKAEAKVGSIFPSYVEKVAT
ncbi:fibronectin type III domain-containing protein [Listeria booriae]|uniref:fibronectin type III domain-containing protein n=1 Tax=Listeria booriae TaxID=1552123 RepID=UPI0016248367|nr:fibronectin type III domain-containing protein [Listeria booriae]MBC2196811.1 fibronectin type III domain-containing protein [Listeria booriae]